MVPFQLELTTILPFYTFYITIITYTIHFLLILFYFCELISIFVFYLLSKLLSNLVIGQFQLSKFLTYFTSREGYIFPI